jgi:hypothetical protein
MSTATGGGGGEEGVEMGQNQGPCFYLDSRRVPPFSLACLVAHLAAEKPVIESKHQLRPDLADLLLLAGS